MFSWAHKIFHIAPSFLSWPLTLGFAFMSRDEPEILNSADNVHINFKQ